MGTDPRVNDPASGPIDLAPANPYSLVLAAPVLLAPGCGIREIDASLLGAIVTRTATLHTPRDAPPRFAPTPAGLVFSHLPAVSLRTLLKEEGRRWERATLPVIVSLEGAAGELEELAAVLETIETVSGLIVSTGDDQAAAVAAVRAQTLRPILAMLEHGPVLNDVAAVVAAGADALIVAAPPRAVATSDPLVDGYLLGPAVFPLTLRALREISTTTDAPRIALGGIVSPEFARAAIDAGAAAVMVDAPRWGDIEAATRIATTLGT